MAWIMAAVGVAVVLAVVAWFFVGRHPESTATTCRCRASRHRCTMLTPVSGVGENGSTHMPARTRLDRPEGRVMGAVPAKARQTRRRSRTAWCHHRPRLRTPRRDEGPKPGAPRDQLGDVVLIGLDGAANSRLAMAASIVLTTLTNPTTAWLTSTTTTSSLTTSTSATTPPTRPPLLAT